VEAHAFKNARQDQDAVTINGTKNRQGWRGIGVGGWRGERGGAMSLFEGGGKIEAREKSNEREATREGQRGQEAREGREKAQVSHNASKGEE
jgi:hypothetical protein